MAKNRKALLKIGDSTFDKIQAFYINPDAYPLSEAVEDIRKRWVYVTSLLLKAYPKFKIANMLEKDFGLSQAQAYLDIRNAENVFGSITKTDDEAFKVMWTEWTKDFLKRARQRKDLKAEAKALDMLAKYSDLSKDDLEFNPEKLKNLNIEVKMPKQLEQYLEQAINSGVIDFNKIDVTDISFEEVENGKED
ncbi:hypothetical protein OOZ35_00230 [Mesoflavibacter profundi]|uniref:Uncharacterized protein n=1 Tax=Mesoflavibacter profundi TaxID=2708110 RepID=A0ABT4RVR2_9FLAO|nr:hypothetical protein [Mesoflavibacter profundi]MDA0175912.1 hypothetical protein [Mesoflavibacter profundi]